MQLWGLARLKSAGQAGRPEAQVNAAEFQSQVWNSLFLGGPQSFSLKVFYCLDEAHPHYGV